MFVTLARTCGRGARRPNLKKHAVVHARVTGKAKVSSYNTFGRDPSLEILIF